jgi:predicted Fe-Mo cluster-binding NifX family protein
VLIYKLAKNMKTLITSTADTVDAPFDKRYGRAAWFCILNEETGETTFYKNENAEAQGGAGTKAAEKTIELGAQKVISGDFGPKAKDLLEKFNIQMVIIEEDLKVKDIVERIKG